MANTIGSVGTTNGSLAITKNSSAFPGMSIPSQNESVPSKFRVEQNYPNPFNPTTEIRYELPEKGHVVVAIYNSIGEKVRTLLSQEQTAGPYQVRWDGTNEGGKNVASGVYFYRIQTGTQTTSKKMLLTK